MNKKRRTRKTFIPYNDYEDRPFGLKWGTAFALSELTKTIKEGENEATRVVDELPQMSRKEIDDVLQQAFFKQKKVSVQINVRDNHDRLVENIEGHFMGFADENGLYISDKPVEWELIRNIRVIEDF